MIQTDKIKHVAVGAVFGLLTIWIPIIWVLIFATIVFVNKEIYDCYKPQPTGFDWWDILADYIGFAVGLSIAILIKYIILI